FVLSELSIGLFGLVSLHLIEHVTTAALNGSLFTIAATAYALLFLPTICMWATLPILVEYLNRQEPNIGKTVGHLYFLNTIGSAAAGFATVGILFAFLGLQSTVVVAALCNFLVAGFAYRCAREGSAEGVGHVVPPSPLPPSPAGARGEASRASKTEMRRRHLDLALALS